MCESPLQRSTRRSFAPSQKSRRNKPLTCVNRDRTRYNFCAGAKATRHIARGKGIRIPESGKFWLLESGILGFWNPEYSSRNSESHNRLESRIQVPMTQTGIQLPGIRNLRCGIQNPTIDWNPESKFY